MDFTSEAVAAFVAAFLSLALEVIPGLRDLWDGVATKYKPLVVLGLSLLVPVGAVGLACGGVDIGLGATCANPADAQLWIGAVKIGFAAFIASQVTFRYVGANLADRLK